jgi:hypothetical protein
MKIEWLEDPLRKVQFLRGSLQNKIMRISMMKAASPVKSTLVTNSPANLGWLKKSVRIKLVYYKAKQIWASILGPSSKFERKGKKIKTGENAGQRKVIKPSRYAPIVEKKTGFISNTLQQTKAKWETDLTAKLRQLIEEALSKSVR